MTNIAFMEKDKMVMKLIRYFIIEQNYSPIVVHGVKDEIWLENLNNEYKVIRIISNYLHNNEQLEFDIFKANKISNSIKMKTLTYNLNVLNIYIDLSNTINHDALKNDNFVILDKKEVGILNKYFNGIDSFLIDNGETEEELFIKITDEINQYKIIENKKTEEIFAFKTPFFTILFLILHSIIYFLMYMNTDIITNLLSNDILKALFTNYNYTGILSFTILNILFYIAASRVEKFYGFFKFLLIYIISLIICSLGALLFVSDTFISLNGIIGSMLGALFYFGAKYRLYIVSLFKNIGIYYILILIMINVLNIKEFMLMLSLGIMSGLFSSMLLSFKYNKNILNRVNGFILLSILIGFLVYMNFYN